MKSEHQKETAFLRHCIRYDESPGRRALDDRITQIQRDERCVRRAMWLMALLAALALAGLGYALIFWTITPKGHPSSLRGSSFRFLARWVWHP